MAPRRCCGALQCVGVMSAFVAHASWIALGPPLLHDTILASSLVLDEGGPLAVYGFQNYSDGNATTILWRRWDAGSMTWPVVGLHTPEFAQPYDGFSLRTRGGLPYLGLRINEADAFGYLGSVLRDRGGWDGADGSYAFSYWTFDFDISPSGDARVIFSPDNSSVAMQTYNSSGWDTYPAGDAWGPVIPILPSGIGPVSDIAVTRGGQGELYAVVSVGKQVHVLATTQSNSSAWSELTPSTGLAVPGVEESLVACGWAGSGPTSTLCVAYIIPGQGGADVQVSCCNPVVHKHGSSVPVSASWVTLGSPISAVSPGLAPGIALFAMSATQTGIVVAGLDAANTSVVRTASMTLPFPLPEDPSLSWSADSIDAPAGPTGAMAVNAFALTGVQPGEGSATASPACSSSSPCSIVASLSISPVGTDRTRGDGLLIVAWE